MDSNTLFLIIIIILLLQFGIETILNYLNARRFSDPIPEELDDVFNKEEYLKSQSYKKTNYRFGLFSSTFSLVLIIAFLVFGGFEWVDRIAAGYSTNPIFRALIFFGIIFLGSDLLGTPFSVYQTFVIEEKYGFNKTTPKLFVMDKLKGWLMLLILGGGILALVIWFFEWAGRDFWLYAWALIACFTIFMNLFYSRLIVPIFNKQTPLKEGSLKSKIESYARQVGFELRNIFVIDGSKRSTKANAYFSGFGREKRVTLFDTLIEDLDEDEIVAVLAHEIGHYKRKHIIVNLFVSVAISGFTLYLLSLFINNPELSMAIGVVKPAFMLRLSVSVFCIVLYQN